MGGGAMIRTVTAAVGAAPSTPRRTTTSNNLPTLPSSSSSNSRFPASGNFTAPFRRHCANRLCHGGVCRCEYVGGRQGERANESFINRVFGPTPSRFEVENAIAALQSFLHGISSSGSESDKRIMETQRYGRIYEAFRLLQTDPSVQVPFNTLEGFIGGLYLTLNLLERMVMSLSSDKVVWDAILNNKMVRKLQEPLCTAEEESSQSSSEEPDLATHILRWILEITKAKIMELVEKFQSLVNEVLWSSEREGSTTETTDQLDEKIVSSTFLAIVILLIVVVARAQSA
ncbi:hypothetical protein CK203_090700 [Vitis vinifera]|uniref:Uncharacterized protein n=1 Tax=Vitis vinifera TaxID=29760 RepID=A0A438BW52_VITVI|nr:hypothetical protein CK203_090700 [Vitis vinifera]